MPYIGNKYEIGDHNNSWKTLDDISSYVATFDGSATNAVSTTNNTIRVPEHRFIQGQRVTYSNGGGGNIGSLTSGAVYYIIHDTNNEFKLATSLANANASTAVNISAVGSGTSHTITAAFDGVNKKFKITYSGGKSSRFTSATQLSVAINNIVQRPNDTTTFTDGFRISDNEKIEFNVAPVAADTFWGSILSASLPTFDVSDNKLDNFTGDGSTTDFTLSHIPVNNEGIIVTINGVIQHPTDKNGTRAYSLDASVLVFTAAPANGDEIQVRHIGFAGASSSSVTGFYGRTGNVTLSSSADNAIVGVITATKFSGPIVGTDLVGTGLTLTSTDAGSSAGPELKLYRDSASPADADYIGQLKFAGESDTGVERNYAKITGKILDASNGTEDGILEFAHIKAGSQTITGRWRSDSLQLLNGTNFSVAGTSEFTGAVDANGDLDVDGHTNLDNVSVAGVSTFADRVYFNGRVDLGNATGDIITPNGRFNHYILPYMDNYIHYQLGNSSYRWHRLNIGTGGINISGAGINAVGIVSATDFSGISGGAADFPNGLTGTTATFSGNVSIGGTLTYEDVTNVDAVGLVTAREGIFLPDSKTIKLGNTSSSPDFTIQHDGTNSAINNTTGSLLFQNNGSSSAWINSSGVIYTNNDIIIQTANGNNILLDKSDNLLRFGDSVLARFGNDNDLEMYHTGSTGYIKNTTGTLYIQDDSNIIIGSVTGSETGAKYIYNDAYELYHNNILSLRTDANGIRVLGPEGGVGQIELFADEGDDNADKWRIQATASGSNFSIQNYVNGSWETSVKATGNSHTELYHGDELMFRTNADGAEFFDSDNNCNVYFTCNGTRRGYIFVDATNGGKIGFMDSQNHWLISGTKNSSVDLYHDNTLRLQTSSTGIEVTGEVAATQDYPNFRPVLDFNFAAVKKLDPRFTYYRTGPASYIDEFGKVVLVGADTPRFDHDPLTRESKGLLIEESRTNLIPNSFDRGTWSTGSGGATVTRNAGTAPDGTETATKILSANNDIDVNPQVGPASAGATGQISISGSTTYTLSIWAKASTTAQVGNNFKVRWKRVQGDAAFAETTFALTANWTRYSTTATTAANNSTIACYLGGVSGSEALVWGAQLEAGSYVTSNIPTYGASVTRGAETVTIEGEDFSDFYNQEEGTLLLSASYIEDNRTGGIVTIDDTSNTSEYTEVGYRAGGGSSGTVGSYIRTDAGNDQYYKGFTSSATQGNEFKVALAYKDNDYASSVNGQTVDTDTSGTTSKVYDRLRFNHVDSVSPPIASSYIRRFMYYSKRLPNGQVVTLTS